MGSAVGSTIALHPRDREVDERTLTHQTGCAFADVSALLRTAGGERIAQCREVVVLPDELVEFDPAPFASDLHRRALGVLPRAREARAVLREMQRRGVGVARAEQQHLAVGAVEAAERRCFA